MRPCRLDPQNAQSATAKPPQNNEPSLGDLGFTPAQTQANAKLQARLNKRTHMLKIHQMLGIITLAPMAATVIVSSGAKPKHSHTVNGTVIEPSSAGVDLHAALGSATAVMYGLTAYYAIAAPKIAGRETQGSDPAASRSGLDPRSGHGADADSRRHGAEPGEPGREASRHCGCPFLRCLDDRYRLCRLDGRRVVAHSLEILGEVMRFALLLAYFWQRLCRCTLKISGLLEQSTLTWHVTHPMHEVDGNQSRREGQRHMCERRVQFSHCGAGEYFPLRRQQSRPAHAAGGPRRGIPDGDCADESSAGRTEFTDDQRRAGSSVRGPDGSLQPCASSSGPEHGKDVEITGTIPATCSDFKIERPSFLTIPIHNEIPVDFDGSGARNNAFPLRKPPSQFCCYTRLVFPPEAGMAELADAADSKSAEGYLVGVRPPLPAPYEPDYGIEFDDESFGIARLAGVSLKSECVWRVHAGILRVIRDSINHRQAFLRPDMAVPSGLSDETN